MPRQSQEDIERVSAQLAKVAEAHTQSENHETINLTGVGWACATCDPDIFPLMFAHGAGKHTTHHEDCLGCQTIKERKS